MSVTTVEDKFKRLDPGWIEQFHKRLTDKKMDKPYNYKLKKFPTCFVGDIRAKLGLSRSYHDGTEDELCDKCALIAAYFSNTSEREEYMRLLKEFEEHLKEIHGKEL
jgi:hypothetical protein